MARSKRKRGSFRARALLGILLGTFAVVWAIALSAYLVDENWRRPADELVPQLGRLNHLLASWTIRILGVFAGWLVPVTLGALAVRLFAGRPVRLLGRREAVIAATAVVLVSAMVVLPAGPSEGRSLLAGLLGTGVVEGLRFLFGGIGAGVVLIGASLAFLAAVGIPVFAPLAGLAPHVRALGERIGDAASGVPAFFRDAFAPTVPAASRKRKRPAAAGSAGEDNTEEEEEETPVRIVQRGRPVAAASSPDDEEGDEEEYEDEEYEDEEYEDEDDEYEDDEDEESEDEDEDEEEEAESEDSSTPIPPDVPVVVLPSAGEPREKKPAASSVEIMTELQTDVSRPYQIPPRNFLETDADDPESDSEREELLDKAKILETALRDFGVRGKVTQVEPGPVITRYEIEPAPGQKVAPIANLADDIALALRARSIRIVAPIPGKAAVGIEIPNPRPRVVHLGSLLETPEYADDPSKVNIALGRTISGEPFCVALDRLPHLLVAGSTGSGKSVCINTIITSIICRSGPEDVRFVMVDPKMLELTTYVGLPHLIPPVVSLPKDTVKILKWAVQEMETRYRTLAHVGVRSIADHNKRLVEEGAPKMPYLVVIIDELADLMLSNVRSEIEESIARLAQMARAVGIHLVVATQRPSVDVITGVIKANFPSRVAFQVPTRTDSRTILDSMGAEKLLGKGDMLYLGVGMSEPMRVHGSYISTEETNDIVEWLKTRNPTPEPQEESGGGPLDGGNDLFPMDREDDLFEEAARILVAHQQGSISLIQRRLKVGYARAARLVDMMEEAGIVGPFTGSKARDILIPTVEELEKKLAQSRHTPLGGKAPA